MRKLLLLSSLALVVLFASCGDEVVVKPAAQLRLQYPIPQYAIVMNECPFSFEKNAIANIQSKSNCGLNITYPKMKATIYLTYQSVEDNLKKLLQDAQKLTYDHTTKANEIFEQPRVDSINKVYGMFYMINGNAATQSQFYVTDSLQHFITGSVYFEVQPDFDSLYPAVVYLREDVRRIMETVTWK